MIDILNIALPFFGLVLLGLLAGRVWKADESGLTWLNIFVVYFALPALIFNVVAATPLQKLANPAYVLSTSGVTTFCFLLMLLLARKIFATPLKTASLQATSASYGNVGYMGLPLAVAFFGPEAAVPAALVFCFDCAVEFVLTPVVAGLDRSANNRQTLFWKITKDLCSHPFIIATTLGIVASAMSYAPEGGIKSILDMLGRAAGPVALFAMGVTVGLRGKPELGRELPVLVLIKLVLQPLLAFFAISVFVEADRAWLDVAVMMAALPTATNAFIMARQNNTYVQGASSAVIATTALSVLTIPLLVYALAYMA